MRVCVEVGGGGVGCIRCSDGIEGAAGNDLS